MGTDTLFVACAGRPPRLTHSFVDGEARPARRVVILSFQLKPVTG